ncbi:hypothetical protein EDC31_1431, partial [Acidomonas methanolica]
TAAMMIPHAIRALGIEPYHPVPHDLTIRPGQPGHVPARRTIVDRRQRQKPTRLARMPPARLGIL